MLKPTLSIVIASCLTMGCALPIKPSTPEPPPLAVASCPILTPLSDDSFGSVLSKLVEVSGIYYACRASAGVK